MAVPAGSGSHSARGRRQSSVDAAMRRLWRCAARTMAEFSVLDRLWDDGRISVDGLEHLDAARAGTERTLIAGPASGNWGGRPRDGAGGRAPRLGFLSHSGKSFEHRIAVRSRERYGGPDDSSDPNRLDERDARAFARHRPFVIYVDEFIRGHVQAPAFGRPLGRDGNIAFAVRMAEKIGATLIPAYCTRLGDCARVQSYGAAADAFNQDRRPGRGPYGQCRSTEWDHRTRRASPY